MDSHITSLIEHMISMSNDKDFCTEDRNICAEIAELLENIDTVRTIDDNIDAASADPELNRVADLRTVLSGIGPNACESDGWVAMTAGERDAITQAIELCDAYIGLRAQCPAGSVVVAMPFDAVELIDDDGEPTTLFDAVTGSLDFSDIHSYVSEVK